MFKHAKLIHVEVAHCNLQVIGLVQRAKYSDLCSIGVVRASLWEVMIGGFQLAKQLH